MKKGKIEKVYHPEVIPDKSDELYEQFRRTAIREREERLATRRHLQKLKQDRIQSSKVDRYTHAIDLIIEWAKMASKNTNPIDRGIKDGSSISVSIPYHHFNFDNDWHTVKNLFETFLNELKVAGCIGGWSTNPYKPVGEEEFTFININLAALTNFKERKQLAIYPPGQNVIYQNHCLFFKLSDNTEIPVDFTAKTQRPIIETFWNLRRNKVNEEYFTKEEVKDAYKNYNHQEINTYNLSHRLPGIRSKIKAKPELNNRFILKFDNEKDKWHFFVC